MNDGHVCLLPASGHARIERFMWVKLQSAARGQAERIIEDPADKNKK